MSGEPKPPRAAPRGVRLLRRLLWDFLKVYSRVVGILFFDVRVFHLDRLPRDVNYLLAPNHASSLDPWFVGMCVPGSISFLARDSLFRIPGFGTLIRALNARPVVRGSQSARQGIDISVRVLGEGERLLLFPEGTRTQDGCMGSLKRGVALIARRGGVPVVPVYIDGTFEAWPRSRKLPRARPIRLLVGEPIAAGDSTIRKDARAAGKSAENQKKAGEVLALVEDGWAQDRPASGPEAASRSRPSPAAQEPDGGAVADAESEAAEPVGDPGDPKRNSSRLSSAQLLAELGEAFRALEDEARALRGV